MNDGFDTSPEIRIMPAERKAARQIIALIGASGSGKTLSALKLGRGLVGPNGKLGVIDTEKGRSTFYADAVKFEVAHFEPPFTPARYIGYLKAFEDAGYGCVVIDSASHEWAGIGGCSEMAETSKLTNDFAKWAYPKREHKKFVNRLTSSNMHVILCLRAMEKSKQVDDPTKPGKKMIVGDGWHPITEKTLPYELVVSILMEPRLPGEPVARRQILKCPETLLPIFDHSGWINEDTGKRLAEWIAGGKPVDIGAERLIARAKEAAEDGVAALKTLWDTLNREDRATLLPDWGAIKSTAIAVDAERGRNASDQPLSLDQIRQTIDSFSTVADLMAWWTAPEATAATDYMQVNDPDAFNAACDAYEQRRERLAA